MKKMVKVILVCTAVLCAIDQIMRFTGPYAIQDRGTDPRSTQAQRLCGENPCDPKRYSGT